MQAPPRVRVLLVGMAMVAGCAQPPAPSGASDSLDQPQSSSLPMASAASSAAPAPSLKAGRLPPPAAFLARERAPSCGVEVVEDGEGWNLAGRQCFLDAFQAGLPAEFTSTVEWMEGNVVTNHLRSLGAGGGEIWVDPSLSADSAVWARLVGCSFYSSDEVLDGPTPEPVLSVGCHDSGLVTAPTMLLSTTGIIPIGSAVRTTLAGLRLRETPGTDAPVVETLDSNVLMLVLDLPASLSPVVADELPWYHVAIVDDGVPDGERRGWVAASDGNDWFLRPQPVSCGGGTQSVEEQVVAFHPFERLACLGSAELTLSGETVTGFGGIPAPGSFEPGWLVEQLQGLPIALADHVAFWVRVPPEITVTQPTGDGIPMRVTGRFDHPAASSCRIDPEGDLHTTSVEAMVMFCRQQFVVSSVELGEAP